MHQKQGLDLPDQVRHLLEEARMVLPGIAALFGFQMNSIFSQRFDLLEHVEQGAHLCALVLSAFAIAFTLAPAAYHRAGPESISSAFVELSSRLLKAGMRCLMLGLCADLYVVSTLILPGRLASGALAALLFLVLLSLWVIVPSRRADRTR